MVPLKQWINWHWDRLYANFVALGRNVANGINLRGVSADRLRSEIINDVWISRLYLHYLYLHYSYTSILIFYQQINLTSNVIRKTRFHQNKNSLPRSPLLYLWHIFSIVESLNWPLIYNLDLSFMNYKSWIHIMLWPIFKAQKM